MKSPREVVSVRRVLLAVGALVVAVQGCARSDDKGTNDTGPGNTNGTTTSTQEPVASGEALCSGGSGCPTGLACQHSSLGASGVCVQGCVDDTSCAPGHRCIDGSDVGFAPACLEQCTTSNDCGGGLGCFDLGAGLLVCVPFDWSSTPSTKGLGDTCASDAECSSGNCAGWCTEACGPGNSLCWGDYDGHNEFGEWNWCMWTNASGYLCFPGCSGGGGVCGNYSGTYCQSGSDADGTATSVCSG